MLHGDLWIGNVSATRDPMPVIYDPASFFGHSELDLALTRVYGEYLEVFWKSCFAKVPKAPGFEISAVLYELYQYPNQLNLFGDPQVHEKVFSHARQLMDYTNQQLQGHAGYLCTSAKSGLLALHEIDLTRRLAVVRARATING
jgi:hypothetical protein